MARKLYKGLWELETNIRTLCDLEQQLSDENRAEANTALLHSRDKELNN